MSDGVYRNLESLEGNATTTAATLTLTRKSRKLVITNDDTTDNLLISFNSSETPMTIQPNESLSLYFTAKQIIVDASAGTVPYRIWVFG
jgi:hypothetical protein